MKDKSENPLFERLAKWGAIAVPIVIFWSVCAFLFSWSYIRSINSSFIKYFTINDFYYLAFEKLDALLVICTLASFPIVLMLYDRKLLEAKRKISRYLIPGLAGVFLLFFAAGEVVAALNQKADIGRVPDCGFACSVAIWADSADTVSMKKGDDGRDCARLSDDNSCYRIYVFGSDHVLVRTDDSEEKFIVLPTATIDHIDPR